MPIDNTKPRSFNPAGLFRWLIMDVSDLHIFEPNKTYRVEARNTDGRLRVVLLNFAHASEWGGMWFIYGFDIDQQKDCSWLVSAIEDVADVGEAGV